MARVATEAGPDGWLSAWDEPRESIKSDANGLISADIAISRSLEGLPAGVVGLQICKAGRVSLRVTTGTKPRANLCTIPWVFKERIIREGWAMLAGSGYFRKDGSSGERYVRSARLTTTFGSPPFPTLAASPLIPVDQGESDVDDSRLRTKYPTGLYVIRVIRRATSILRCCVNNHRTHNVFERHAHHRSLSGTLFSDRCGPFPKGTASIYWDANSASCHRAPGIPLYPVGYHVTTLPHSVGSNLRCENRVFVSGQGSALEVRGSDSAGYVVDVLPDI